LARGRHDASDVRFLLDHLAGIVAAGMARNLRGTGDHTHGRGAGEQRQWAAHVDVGNRVAVAIEAHIRCLAGHDGAHHLGREGMRGERQEPRLLLREDLGDGPIALLGMQALMRNVVTPAPKLRIQIVHIDKHAGGEERVPEVVDLPLDLPFLIPAAGRAGPGREVIVPGEFQEPRMKSNRGARAFQDRAAQIVVDQGPWHARPCLKGLDMAPEKTLKRLVDGEEREDGARVREHHHETGKRAHAAADADRAEGSPIDLGLLAGQGGEPAIHRRRGRRTNSADGASQLHDRTGVPASLHHLKEPCRPQTRILRQRVADEGQRRIEQGRAARAAAQPLSVVHDRGADRVMVDAEGRGDGADLPMLAVIEAPNLGVLLGRDHGVAPGTHDESARAVEGARRFPGHRPCNATRPPGARSAPDPSLCPRAV